VLSYKLKSILDVGSKVRSSIEDPFREVNLVGKRSCWVTRQRSRYDHCIGTCECYYLVSSFVFRIVEFLGLAAPEWFFSLIFVDTYAHTLFLEVNSIF
jgi:hypothetical protein